MANLNEAIFLLQFSFMIFLFFLKLYNVLSNFDIYDWKISVMLFIGGLLTQGINLVTTIISYDSILISQLSKLQIMPFLLIVLFTVIEFFMTAQKATYRNRYDARGSRYGSR